ncbi:MAG TPA: hypothetical protein VGJ40_07535 [Gaiellaceae bacterium]
MIFRREPIHKKLAREARLDLERGREAEPIDPGPHWGETGIHGVPRPRRWDAVGSAEAPGLTGDEVHFVALPNGDLVVDEDIPADTLGPLAEAVEQAVEPPYRAEAVRRGEDMWAIAARRVRIAELDAAGDELELTVNDGERTLKVDGERTFGSVPELELLGSSEGAAYAVRAVRLEGRLWEVEVTPL